MALAIELVRKMLWRGPRLLENSSERLDLVQRKSDKLHFLEVMESLRARSD